MRRDHGQDLKRHQSIIKSDRIDTHTLKSDIHGGQIFVLPLVVIIRARSNPCFRLNRFQYSIVVYNDRMHRAFFIIERNVLA